MKRNHFTGPLFVVGMPRSGTTLLRDLLNQNPRISILGWESHFIPYMVERFGNPPRLEDEEEFQRFFDELQQTNFFWTAKRKGQMITQEYITRHADKTSWNSLLEALFRFLIPHGNDQDIIWGDKTPLYLKHIVLLKELFPAARFLHIIRDPRDFCLSMMRIWGKSLYRSAHRWRSVLEIQRAVGRRMGKDYMEVHYESLLANPEGVLRLACEFLECDFVPTMIQLREPIQSLGDARDQSRIVHNNMRKYLTDLRPTEIKRIEEIVYPVAIAAGYMPKYATGFHPVSPLMLSALRFYDGWGSLKFHVNHMGLRQGLSYFGRLHRHDS